MKRLAWLSVEDYAATQMELVVVSAMKGYLRRMPEKEALKKVEGILDPKVIRLAGDDGAPMPVQSNVDGAKLAAFIDAAVADSTRELEKREDDLSGAGVTMLGNVDGKTLDNDEAKWRSFTSANDMPWINVQGIDADKRSTAAAAYGITSIPANFLISPDGIIVAKNLRGGELSKKLAEMLE